MQASPSPRRGPARALVGVLAAALAALAWPACDYPAVTFAPPVPVPSVACNDMLTCDGGQICCLHTEMGACDKCLSPEACEAATTCAGAPADFIPLGCDTPDDCAMGLVCCILTDSATVTGVGCVEASACERPLCSDAAPCATGACSPLIPNDPAYVGYTFCL